MLTHPLLMFLFTCSVCSGDYGGAGGGRAPYSVRKLEFCLTPSRLQSYQRFVAQQEKEGRTVDERFVFQSVRIALCMPISRAMRNVAQEPSSVPLLTCLRLRSLPAAAAQRHQRPQRGKHRDRWIPHRRSRHPRRARLLLRRRRVRVRVAAHGDGVRSDSDREESGRQPEGGHRARLSGGAMS